MAFRYEAKSKKREDEQKPKYGVMARLRRGLGTAIFSDGKIIIEPDQKESNLNE